MSAKWLRGRPWVWAIAALVVVASTAIGLQVLQDDPEELETSTYLSLLADDEVATVTDRAGDQVLEGELADGTAYEVGYNPELVRDELGDALRDARARGSLEVQDTDPQSGPSPGLVLLNALPFLLILGLFVFLMVTMQGGGRAASFGRSKAKTVAKDTPTVTFGDVAGADEAVEELREVRDFLADPSGFTALGATIPKGVLLFGPPGTGKTLLARAVAGEVGAPFFSISGSDFVEMFVGVGASRVRDLFKQAKEAAPAIIFVDEIDAVGRHRGAGMGGGHDEREQTLNQLLVEMDGFEANAGVILIAATNRPDILDPALLRPGRFDRQITVDQPDVAGRRAILEVHTAGKPVADRADLDVIARRTPGFTGADLANLVNEAALLTARRGAAELTGEALEDAIDRVIAGPERRTRLMTEAERRTIAYHEGGHAIVGHALPHADPIHKVSVIPRGRALGWTLALPTQDHHLISRAQLIDRLAMMLGGRVAEELTIGDYTTGAADDIEKVTAIARDMVTRYGMSALGPVRLGSGGDEPFVGRDGGGEPSRSESLAQRIDAEVAALVDEAHDEALEILVANREVLEDLADALIADETVEGARLDELLSRVAPRPSRGLRPVLNGTGERLGAEEAIRRLRRRERAGATNSLAAGVEPDEVGHAGSDAANGEAAGPAADPASPAADAPEW